LVSKFRGDITFDWPPRPSGSLGVPIARDAALVEAGGEQAKVGVSYAGQLANSAHDHSVKCNFTWRL